MKTVNVYNSVKMKLAHNEDRNARQVYQLATDDNLHRKRNGVAVQYC